MSLLDTAGVFLLTQPWVMLAVIAGWCGACLIVAVIQRHNERKTP